MGLFDIFGNKDSKEETSEKKEDTLVSQETESEEESTAYSGFSEMIQEQQERGTAYEEMIQEQQERGTAYEEIIQDREDRRQEEDEEVEEEPEQDERQSIPVYLPSEERAEEEQYYEYDEETGRIIRPGEDAEEQETQEEVIGPEETVEGKLMLTKDGEGLEINHPQRNENIVVNRENFNEQQEVAFEQLKAASEIENDLVEKFKSMPLGIGPSATIGDAIGSIYGQRKASNRLEEEMIEKSEIVEDLRDELKSAMDNEDFERAKHINKMIGMTVDEVKPHAELLQKELDEAPSRWQVAGAGAELAGLAITAYNPGQVAVPTKGARPWSKVAPKVGQKIGDLNSASAKLKAVVGRYVPVAAKGAAETALLDAGMVARSSKDATVDEIIQAAEGGAKFGATFDSALVFSGDMLKLGVKNLGPKIKSSRLDLAKRLDDYAATGKAAKSSADMPKSATEIALDGIHSKPTIKQKLSKKAATGLKVPDKLKQKFLDRFTSLERMEDMILTQKDGGVLDESEKFLRDSRMLDSYSAGMAEKKIAPFYKELAQHSQDVQEHALGYLKNLDDVDRLNLGMKVSGDGYSTVAGAKANLTKLATEVGPDKMKEVGQIRRKFKRITDQNLLDDFNAGLISKDDYKNIIDKHPNYIPHDVISDSLEQKARYMGGGNSLNVSQKHIRNAFGSNKKIENPFVSLASDTVLGEKIREKNKLLNNIVDSIDKYDIFPGAKEIKAGDKVDDGFTAINFFKNGEKKRWQVPSTIGSSIKNLDAPVSGKVLEGVARLNRIMKKGATSWNPAFILRNKVRDLQRASQYADPFIRETAERYGFADEAIKGLTGDELTSLYKEGGIGSSIFREGSETAVEKLKNSGISKTIDLSSVNPLDAIEEVNLAVEHSTRKSVLAKALNAGLSRKDAVWVARNTSVDYGRMGEWMRPAKQAIPFLNAHVQGLSKLPKSILQDPARFAEATYTTAVLPTKMLYQHNRRYESHKYISPALKANNWVIMTGEIETVHPDSGDPIVVPQYITIPRGEGQSAVAAPLEWMLEKQDGINDRKVTEMLADGAMNISPVDFGSSTNNNMYQSLIARTGPIGTGFYGAASNTHPYFGNQIIPTDRTGEQVSPSNKFDDNTPEILKDLPEEVYNNAISKKFNINPAMAEYYATIFGTGPQQLLEGIDIAYNRAKDDGTVGGLNPVTGTKFETVSNLPGFDSFFRQSEWNASQRDTDIIDEAKREVNDERVRVEEKAKDILNKIQNSESDEEAAKIINTLGDEFTPELAEELRQEMRVTTSVRGLRSTESDEIKLKVIRRQAKVMGEREYNKFIERLVEEEVVDSDTFKEIQNIE